MLPASRSSQPQAPEAWCTCLTSLCLWKPFPLHPTPLSSHHAGPSQVDPATHKAFLKTSSWKPCLPLGAQTSDHILPGVRMASTLVFSQSPHAQTAETAKGQSPEKGLNVSCLKARVESRQRKQETGDGRVGVDDGGQGTSKTASVRGGFQRWSGFPGLG